MGIRINIGCGMTVTDGWINIDNSLSLMLCKLPSFAIRFMRKLGLASAPQYNYILFAKKSGILRADAANRLPFASESVEVIYTSHMMEHLDRHQACNFLAEARRVLKSGGVIRVSVPDLQVLVDQYNHHKDADHMIESMGTCIDNPRTLLQRLKCVIVGSRHHSWMYDGKSLCKKLLENGFVDAQVQPPGITRIKDYGNLNLSERADASVYVEALKS